MREARGWSQEDVAKFVGMPQTAISRLESPSYGKATITTLKRMAKVYDVGLAVRFEPFSKLMSWVSGTPYIENGLTSNALAVPSFGEESSELVSATPKISADVYFDQDVTQPPIEVTRGASPEIVLRVSTVFPDRHFFERTGSANFAAMTVNPFQGRRITPNRVLSESNTFEKAYA
jgi:transcriptional regulator with XRE-family HTH domain